MATIKTAISGAIYILFVLCLTAFALAHTIGGVIIDNIKSK